MRSLWRLAQFCVLLLVAASAYGQGYHVVSVKDGGTIRGLVKWSGPVPKLATLTINKDPKICDPDAHGIADLERLVIGPEGGVANTVVFLKDVTSGKALDLPTQRQFLDQKHCRYIPHILLVPANGTLQMKSSDATLHTIHMEGAATYNLPFPFPNQVISHQMSTPGLTTLRCNGGHNWMNAEMLVVSHPYYAVTDESGGFTLTDVPPGDYEIVAWHEGWKIMRQETSIDVLTQHQVARPVFPPGQTWSKKITIRPNDVASVTFTIAEK
ncbi:MAG: carboxypeptidase regulatory-like domain-containing protein [Acidobacteria bacterium]|nr:carboxypeptidase regulatory-like domain-containing protein [Acidobacteriota bacterium]